MVRCCVGVPGLTSPPLLVIQSEVNYMLQHAPGQQITQQLFVQLMEKRLQVLDPDERIRQIFKSFDYRCACF